MSKWTMIYSEPDEHRVFQAEDGRTAIADRSGSNPSNTDDGPLYVAPNTEAEAYCSGKSIRVQVPVSGDRSGGYVSVSLDCFEFLRDRLGLVLRLTGDIKKLVALGAPQFAARG
jgi:hypothetical protein